MIMVLGFVVYELLDITIHTIKLGALGIQGAIGGIAGQIGRGSHSGACPPGCDSEDRRTVVSACWPEAGHGLVDECFELPAHLGP